MVIFGFFMEFVHPGVLYFLPDLFIPVIIHLFNFRRYQKVYFSNVGNLMEFAKEHKSRNQIREILLLLVRILTLFFLILAFAGLRWSDTRNAKIRPGETHIIDLYVDNSQSMNLPGDHGTLLEEVKKKVKDLTDLDIPGRGNISYGLLTNDFSGSDYEVLDKEELLDRLTRIQASVQHRTLDEILNRFQEIHALNSKTSKQVFLFSDFQLNTIRDKDPKAFGKFIRDFDSTNHATTHLGVLHPKAQSNIYIDSVWNLSPIQKLGENDALVVRLKRSYSGNPSDLKNISLPIRLIHNSKIKALGLVHFTSSPYLLDTLRFQIQNTGSQEIKIEIEDEPINYDNTFYAAWNIPQSMDIYRIHGPGKSPFVSTVFSTDPFFHFIDYDENLVDFNQLSRENFVILDGVRNPGTGLLDELKKLGLRGGSWVYVPPLPDSSSKDLGIGKIRDFMRSFSLNEPIAWVKQDQKMTTPSLNKGILEGVFDRFPKNLDLPVFLSYLQWKSNSIERSQVLLSLLGKEPYLSEYRSGSGSIYVFSSPFQDSFTNFMRHPFFLPVFYNLAFRSMGSFPLEYTLGRKEFYKTQNWTSAEMKNPVWKGDSSRIIPKFVNHNGLELDLGLGPQKSGFYHLELNSVNRQTFAFNYDRSESELKYYQTQDLGLKTKNRVLENDYAFKSLQSMEEGEGGFPLSIWKVCLILALLFLAIEQALIRIKSPAY